jgi:hypothetical protein
MSSAQRSPVIRAGATVQASVAYISSRIFTAARFVPSAR